MPHMRGKKPIDADDEEKCETCGYLLLACICDDDDEDELVTDEEE